MFTLKRQKMERRAQWSHTTNVQREKPGLNTVIILVVFGGGGRLRHRVNW
jgi:hypothetical protein